MSFWMNRRDRCQGNRRHLYSLNIPVFSMIFLMICGALIITAWLRSLF